MEKRTLVGVVSFALAAGLIAAAQSVLSRAGSRPLNSDDAIHGKPFPSSVASKWWV
jgi:hypothetical protein